MGDFSEHVLFGLLVATVVAFLFQEFSSLGRIESVFSITAVFVGSVIPDIDHKKSYVHRSVKAFTSIVAGVLVIMLFPFSIHINFGFATAIFLGVYSSLSHLTVRHRGVTHTISFCVVTASITVIAAVFTFGSVTPGVAMGIGLGSHLLLDQEFKL